MGPFPPAPSHHARRRPGAGRHLGSAVPSRKPRRALVVGLAAVLMSGVVVVSANARSESARLHAMRVGTAAQAKLRTTARAATGTAAKQAQPAAAPRTQQSGSTTASATTATATPMASAGGGGGETRGNFVSVCGHSHRAKDDPIVHPGVAGASHSHDFSGNTSTNANSSYQSLLAAGTTCQNRADTAAYWVPTLMQGGKVVNPMETRAYYRARTAGQIQPYPPGLRVVAGNAAATSPQSTSIVAWSCPPGGGKSSSVVPTCRSGTDLRLGIVFPDCWNGTTLDSADHASHLAYSHRGSCPASHPVALPSLEVYTSYAISGGPGVTLASGAPLTAHADFFNAWDQATLASLVNNCLNASKFCKRV